MDVSTGVDVLVLSSGAIGSVVAARLSILGRRSVLCVDRWEEHVKSMQDGLMYVQPDGSTHVADVLAISLEDFRSSSGTYQNVLLCCKSGETLDYLDGADDWLAPDGYIVSLQNGMNEFHISNAVGSERTVGGVVLLDGRLQMPGLVESKRASATLKLGTWTLQDDPQFAALNGQQQDRISWIFQGAVDVHWTKNIRKELASKLLKNCVLNAPTAIFDMSVPEIFHDDEIAPLLGFIAAECAEVLAANGFEVNPDITFGLSGTELETAHESHTLERFLEAGRAEYPLDTPITSSMWQDLYAGRPTEVRALNGQISTLGTSAQVPTPWNDSLLTLVERIEGGARVGTRDELVQELTAGWE